GTGWVLVVLVCGGFGEGGQGVVEIEGDGAGLDLEDLFGEQSGRGRVTDLPGPGDFPDPGVDPGAEQLLRDVLELYACRTVGSAQECAGQCSLLVEGGHPPKGVVLTGVGRGDIDGGAGHVPVGVVEPPLAVGPIGLDRTVGEVAVDVPEGDHGVDLGFLDRRHPLDHLSGYGCVVVERVLVDVDREFGALVVGSGKDLGLPAPITFDRTADLVGVAQLVPGDDVGDRPGLDGVFEETFDLVEEQTGVGPGDAHVTQFCADECVGLVPG